MLLQLEWFVLLYTTTFLHYSYSSSSLVNINQHFIRNNNSTFASLNQHSAYAIMDLTGSIHEGTFQVKLKLGQHAKEYYFLIDTGSVLTWVNCERQSSTHAAYPHAPFVPSEHNQVLCSDHVCPLIQRAKGHPCNKPTDKCSYECGYLDQSSSTGELITESLAIPFVNVDHRLHHPSIKIGCGLHNVHHSDTIVDGRILFDGIIGLGKNSDLAIINQLQNKGITKPVFGHCMSRISGGYFFIGRGKPLPRSITWARMVMLHYSDNHYSAGRVDILFNGNHTIVKNLDMTFDSGSTNSYLTTSAVKAFIERIKASLVGTPLKAVQRGRETHDYPICWRTKESITSFDQVAHYFKTFTLFFWAADRRLDLSPYSYLALVPIPDNPYAGQVCLAIFDATEFGLGELNLIGANFFLDKLVVFDIERKKIGWAHSDCNHRETNDRKHNNVTDRGYFRKGRPIHHFSSNIRELLQRRKSSPLST